MQPRHHQIDAALDIAGRGADSTVGVMASTSAKAIQTTSAIVHLSETVDQLAYYFLAAAGAPALPRMALKNSLLGSSTITSVLLRKVVR